jgi:hypothetical protein
MGRGNGGFLQRLGADWFFLSELYGEPLPLTGCDRFGEVARGGSLPPISLSGAWPIHRV